MLVFYLLFLSTQESDMLSFIRLLKSMLMVSNAVAIVTFPPSMLSPSTSKRLQHMADTLLSIKAIPDGDKELEKLLTGYKDINGFLNIHKVARINTQVLTNCISQCSQNLLANTFKTLLSFALVWHELAYLYKP